MGKNYFTAFKMAGQFKGYLYAINKLRPELGGVSKFVINALCLTYKGGIELGRQPFYHTRQSLVEWQEKTMYDIERLVGMAQSGVWGVNNWKGCYFCFGTSCPYLPLCESQDEGVKEFLLKSDNFVDYTWNPLND